VRLALPPLRLRRRLPVRRRPTARRSTPWSGWSAADTAPVTRAHISTAINRTRPRTFPPVHGTLDCPRRHVVMSTGPGGNVGANVVPAANTPDPQDVSPGPPKPPVRDALRAYYPARVIVTDRPTSCAADALL
jgi:hypothetical protein